MSEQTPKQPAATSPAPRSSSGDGGKAAPRDQPPPQTSASDAVMTAGLGAARSDPQRRAHHDMAGASIKGYDPKRHYVFVNRGDVTFGVEFYLELGYVVETFREGGPMVRAGKVGKAGEEIVYRGQTLMSISKEDHAALRKHGADMAGTGTEHWDKVAKQINSSFNPIKNMPGARHMSISRAIDLTRITG